MTIGTLLVVLLIIVILGLCFTYLPMDPRTKQIFGIVIAVILVVWLLGILFPGILSRPVR